MNLSDYQSRFVEFLFGADGFGISPNAEVYRIGVEAKAVRALGYRYPTCKRLLGDAVFRELAIEYLRWIKKRTGDWNDFGFVFPNWIISHRISKRVPYIADVSRLDNYVGEVERVPYDDVNTESFSVIEDDLSSYTLALNSALKLFRSAYPIVSIWEAHKSPNPRDTLSFAQARRMIGKGKGQNALVFRSGGRGMVQTVPEEDFVVLQRLKEQRSITQAFGEHDLRENNFSGWLQDMIEKKVIVGARHIH